MMRPAHMIRRSAMSMCVLAAASASRRNVGKAVVNDLVMTLSPMTVKLLPLSISQLDGDSDVKTRLIISHSKVRLLSMMSSGASLIPADLPSTRLHLIQASQSVIFQVVLPCTCLSWFYQRGCPDVCQTYPGFALVAFLRNHLCFKCCTT